MLLGSRQVGKTTLARQAFEALGMSGRMVSADEPTLRGRSWLEEQWDLARLEARRPSGDGALLVVDEIQKVGGWSETVKRLWDEDSASGMPLRVALLGSAPLLVEHGLTESIAGRFEITRVPHWSFAEMRDAFDMTLDDYVYFGGYPGAASLRDEPERWSRYIRDAIIETTIARDVLLLTRVDKPALLRRLFQLGCEYSGQMLSYTKLLGQLSGAGNTTTLAHYLDLLAGAGLLAGLQKLAASRVRVRGSSPKLQVFNTALMSAVSGLSPRTARDDRLFWGRLVESSVGAHLLNQAAGTSIDVLYWREGDRAVDFVLRAGRRLVAIEVKSGHAHRGRDGMAALGRLASPHRKLLVGGDGMPLEEFLVTPVSTWFDALD